MRIAPLRSHCHHICCQSPHHHHHHDHTHAHTRTSMSRVCTAWRCHLAKHMGPCMSDANVCMHCRSMSADATSDPKLSGRVIAGPRMFRTLSSAMRLHVPTLVPGSWGLVLTTYHPQTGHPLSGLSGVPTIVRKRRVSCEDHDGVACRGFPPVVNILCQGNIRANMCLVLSHSPAGQFSCANA